ncbi:hypothetical protein H1230_18995 [Paenibacillus sp. 19GGS1-52]|uniref:hypothetical protein n=1 Tax=Paenibacillus sp. 19GGS1-52 TaxID=2758563 RepID=UPI001EFA44F8|nr:hypothetical protein [Paenibacillus sp. 19GGS1-52]ULO05195.1 hypothetical protein H1230_18995 [Paenibacillus sp. 19GGS1-52]
MRYPQWIAASIATSVLFTGIISAQPASAAGNTERQAASVASNSAAASQKLNFTVSDVPYSSAEYKKIIQAFASFDGFETAYVPTRMITGDTFQKVGVVGDSVTFFFKYMRVSVSPRDYSYSYKGTVVTLPESNNVKGKWYKVNGTDMLTFPLKDRYVTIFAPYHSLSKTKLEHVAVDVSRYAP